jgi:hypothetical protein
MTFEDNQADKLRKQQQLDAGAQPFPRQHEIFRREGDNDRGYRDRTRADRYDAGVSRLFTGFWRIHFPHAWSPRRSPTWPPIE